MPGEPLRGGWVAQLGTLTEREQGLVAACRDAGAGDREDVLGAQVCSRRGEPEALRKCSSRTGPGRAS